MSVKLINVDLEDEQLELVNWILKEPSETHYDDNKIMIFIYANELNEFANLVEACGWEFADGAIEMHLSRHNVVIDVYQVLQSLDIDPQIIIDQRYED